MDLRREVPTIAPPFVESFREAFAPNLDPDGETIASPTIRTPLPSSPAPHSVESAPDSAPRSGGYYSMSFAREEELQIPPAPKLPELDLDGLESAGDSDHPTLVEPTDVAELERMARAAAVARARGRGLSGSRPAPPPETEPPFRDMDGPRAFSSSSTPAPASSITTISGKELRSATTSADRVSGAGSRRHGSKSSVPPAFLREDQPFDLETFPSPERASRPPRLYFSPHVRRQANEWASTGSLSLPGCSSPRHARALQRALLLALLTDPGWEKIPQGLRQRAGWLFCEHWDAPSSDTYREVDDLATVMGMPAGTASRNLLSQAVAAVLPSSAASRRSSRPPGRHSSRPAPVSRSAASSEFPKSEKSPSSRPPRPR